ncbi:MAG TPA: DUF1648 domain-containing protein, partial [Dehalococcoidales bacterium]|nr:DUF1648 domain-containing protein [Dehalococcoidales bacterium]
MKKRLSNPLWTHIPAALALVGVIVYTVLVGPLPAHAPVHFDLSGEPDQYGSPYMVFGLVVGLSILFIFISAIIDDIWARYEKRKTFNWFCLLDEIIVGAIGGAYFNYLDQITYGSGIFGFDWTTFSMVLGSAVVLGVILEVFRPFSPRPERIIFSDTSALQKELAEKLKNSSAFFYWETQNPFWNSLLSVIIPLVMIGVAIASWFQEPWVSLIVFLAALCLIMPFGGFRISVTPREVTVRFGLLGFKLLRLDSIDVAEVELVTFRPLHDFGGYGIRFGRGMKAYFLRGPRGVKLTA